MDVHEPLVKAEAITDQDLTTLFLQRNLQVIVVQDLDERVPQTRHLHSIPDPLNQQARINMRANISQQNIDKFYKKEKHTANIEKTSITSINIILFTWFGERVTDKLIPQFGIVVRLAEINRLMNIAKLAHVQIQRVNRVAHASYNYTTTT